MSLYIKEKPEYLTLCMESILAQTVLPSQIVIVLDGPITSQLQAVLDRYQQQHNDLIHLVPLPQNRGLGLALAEGLLHCDYELVARMDTDDICKPDRFEKQLAEFTKNPALDICGSHIAEFENDPSVIKGVRQVPLTNEQIKAYQRKRDGFNHVSVMFKKSSVLRAGNYQHALLMEDSLLWCNMFKAGAVGMNIDESLVLVRAGDEMIARRGGFSYFLKYRTGRKKILETGYISRWDYYETLAVQLVVALMPAKIRLFIFKKLLRRN